ncbi:MAG TPA: transglycosylase domain-containing protein [Kofleriaceae bacterium]|nr:transglycosylase domain-containing protein [Kofleriaceae bacterium]
MKRRVVVANRGAAWWARVLVLVGWAAFATPVVIGGWAVATLRGWARDLPVVPDLAAWAAHAPQTSRVVAADGTLLAELPFADGPAVGRRTLAGGDGVPPVLVQAVLAAEDVRFTTHAGVDYRAIARAAWVNHRAGRIVEGASTITQQLARNLLPAEIGTARSLRRKVREALLARRLERAWSKPQILAAYLDFVFLGAGAYGVVAAAEVYFGKPLDQLDVGEAALLAGVIQAPSRLDPWIDPAAARARRDEVLARMARAGWLTDEARAAAAARPLALARRPEVYGTRAPWYTEHVRRQLADVFADEVARGGLTVETAALPALAGAAEDEAARVARTLDRGGGPPELAAIAWDHRTGYVEAMVGGRAWRASQFDRLTQACRQPGSAWKPLVYAAALERGAITTGTPLRDAPIAEYDEATGVHWKPRAGRSFRGVALVADALAASLNAAAIDVLDRVGAPAVIDLARRLGVTTPVTDVRPMALGASCVKPVELARVYAVLARRGWDVEPRAIVRIRRGDEVLVDDAVPEDPWLDPARRLDRLAAVAGRDPDQRVGAVGGALVDERTSFLIADLLTGVIQRGTATAARALGRPAAGKTGTTNDNSDAWFVGFTARVVAAVWVGHDDPAVKLGPKDDGAHAALPSWMRLVRAAEGDRPPGPVPGPPPPGLERARIDRESGLLAAPGAGGALDLWFVRGTAPVDVAGRPGAGGTDFARSAREF